MTQSLVAETIEEISKRLADFSSEISDCLDNSEWEKLGKELEIRQQYFEKILVLTEPVSEEYRLALIQIVQQVLDQDAQSLSKIHDHQKQLIEHLNVLENGKRAIKAYSGR